jgi:hypothetical protein
MFSLGELAIVQGVFAPGFNGQLVQINSGLVVISSLQLGYRVSGPGLPKCHSKHGWGLHPQNLRKLPPPPDWNKLAQAEFVSVNHRQGVSVDA